MLLRLSLCVSSKNSTRFEMSRNKYAYKTIDGKKKRIHRHIMEEQLGRVLKNNEHVYHLNGNPEDNSIENLVVITKKGKND